MGEATYYCKMKFKSEELAVVHYPTVKKFFSEGIAAKEFWKTNWGMLSEEFWPEFKKRFPLISEYITNTFPEVDNGNGLAGLLNFGGEDDIENLEVNGNEIWYYAYVWHFANWEGMLSFICKKVVAEFLWVDADDIEPFDCLKFE